MFAEIVGAWWTGSLALLADAGHMFTDVAALILALIAVWFGSRPATSRKTFGYYRLEIIAALVNGVALGGDFAFHFLRRIRTLACASSHSKWADDRRGGRRSYREPALCLDTSRASTKSISICVAHGCT